VSTTCDELLPAVAAHAAGLPLSEAERASCEDHLERCRSCPQLEALVVAALAGARLEPRFAPDATWERIAASVREERAKALAAPVLKVLLSCTFCHAALERRDAAFCAACLAPHHGECFEIHGRCSASGCDETHTVAPRATAPRRRRRFARLPWLVVGLGAVAGAALTGSKLTRTPAPSPVVAESPYLLGDAKGETPAYPAGWRSPAPGSPQERLEAIRLSPKLRAVPFFEALEWIRANTGLSFVVSSGVRDLIARDAAEVDLEANDARAWDVLGLLVSQRSSVGFECTSEVVRITTTPDGKTTVNVGALLANEAWRGPCHERLGRRAAFHLVDTRLADAVDLLARTTGVPFRLSRSIDGQQVKVTFDWDGPVETGLNELMWIAGLGWELRSGTVLIAPEEEIALRHCDLAPDTTVDIRGVTVPQLLLALEDRLGGNARVVATERAWQSRGTVSLVSREGVPGAFAALTSETGLRATILHASLGPVPGTVVVLDGEAPGLEEARSATPAPSRAVEDEIARLRQRLESELEERSAARLNSQADLAELGKREAAVTRTVGRIVALARRSREIAAAPGRLPAVASSLAAERVAAAKAEAEAASAAAALARAEGGARPVDAKAVEARRSVWFLAEVASVRAARRVEALAREAAEVEVDAARTESLRRGEPLVVDDR
jgi:hypothetical protein